MNKLTLKGQAEISISSESKKGSMVALCSIHKGKAFEFLMVCEKDELLIGAKRIVHLGDNKGISTDSKKTNKLQGKHRLINGVDWSCLHCSNDRIVFCCDVWSCSNGIRHVCPTCGSVSTRFRTVKELTGQEKNAVSKAQGKNLPHLNMKLLK